MATAVKTALTYISHAIGGGTLNPLLGSPLDLVNRVGRAVTTMHPWRYLRRIQTLSTTAAQDYVNLPLNTAEVEKVEGSGPLNFYLEKTSLLEIARWRSSVVQYQNPQQFLWALEHADNPNGGEPQPRIALYPTPGTSTQDAFFAVLRLGWADVSDDNLDAEIPWYLDELFLEFVRAMASGLEGETLDRSTPSYADVRDRLRQSSAFSDAVDQDNRMHPNLGQPLSGWMGASGRLYRHLDLDSGVPITF